MDEKQLLAAFVEAGLDTQDKVLTFLGGAVKPSKVAAIKEKIREVQVQKAEAAQGFEQQISDLQNEIAAIENG